MLIWITERLRGHAACALAVVYALCVLAPAAAFAFGDSARASHCLTGDRPAAASSSGHEHHGAPHAGPADATHEHASAGGEKEKSGDTSCCGVMCLTGVPAVAPTLAFKAPTAAIVQSAQPRLDGREPARLSRPPDSPSSI